MRDYARSFSTSLHTKTKPGIHPRTKLIIIIVVGLFIFALVAGAVQYIYQTNSKKAVVSVIVKRTPEKKVEKPKKIIKTTKVSVTTSEQNFSFYKMLPSMTVDVATPQPATNSSATENKTVSQPSYYILQIASFRAHADAIALKDSLAQSVELPFEVIEVQVEDTVWYRVQAGPFDGMSQAKIAQKRLAQDSLIRKAP